MDEDEASRDLAACRTTLTEACAALADLDAVLYQAAGEDLAALMSLVDALVMAAELGRVEVTAEALARGETGGRAAALSPAQWVMAHAPSTRAGGAGVIVSTARDLARPANAPIRAALVAGRIGVRSAASVVSEIEKLRPLLAAGAEAPVIEGLVAMAGEHGPRGCRMVRPRLLAQYGLEGELQREQDATRQFVSLSQPQEVGSGIFEYALTLDTEGMCVLEAAIGPMAAPRPVDGERDLRGSDRRRGDALVALVRRAVASGDRVPTTSKAQLFVTMDFERLADRLSATTGHGPGPGAQGPPPSVAAGVVTAGTQDGMVLAPETVRRIACDATLVPLVLGGTAEVLDWGRSRRLFTPAQTRRLWLRDGGCSYPACDAPAQWCDAHHLVHWADGGPSDQDNAALLCEHHHQLVHRRRVAGWVITGPSGSRVEWDRTPGSYDALLARRATQESA